MPESVSDVIGTGWFAWGIGVILAFQILVVVLGELLYRADRRARPIAPIMRAARNAVLPLTMIYLFVVNVLEQSDDTIAVRAISTALWLSVLYTGLLLLNVLVFQQAPEGSWRHRAPSLFQDLLRILLIAVGAAIVLAVVWDQNLGGLIAALGVGSIVLGLALQETLGNLMSGIALLFEKPFTIGDWIEVGGEAGEVVEINWRSVQIRTREKNLLVLPNSVLGRETIINYARPTALQTLRLSFGFSLDDPPNKVKAMLVSVAEQLDVILDDPAPRALLREVQNDRLRYEAFLYIDQPKLIPQIIDQYSSRVWYAAQRARLRLPLPAAREYQISAPTPTAPDEISIDVAAELASAQGFDVLDPEAVQNFAAAARVLRFGDGEVLVARGAIADGIYLIVHGEVRVTMPYGDNTAEVTVSRGEIVGITSLARQESSEADIVAVGDVTTVRVDHQTMDQALRANPGLAHRLARLIEIRREALAKSRQLPAASSVAEDTVLPVLPRKPQSKPDEDGDEQA